MKDKETIVVPLAHLIIVSSIILIVGCSKDSPTSSDKIVPHNGKWGIYSLDLATGEARLVHSSSNEIQASSLRLNASGERLVFAQKTDMSADETMEIFTIGTNGSSLQRVTNNVFWDLYPVWSPDGGRIAFLSKRASDLDTHVINSSGSNEIRLYDSGSNDADIDWVGNSIVFTSGFKIWSMTDSGTQPVRITNPPPLQVNGAPPTFRSETTIHV